MRFYRAALFEESKIEQVAKWAPGKSLQWNEFLSMTRSERIACAVREYNAMFVLDVKKVKGEYFYFF